MPLDKVIGSVRKLDTKSLTRIRKVNRVDDVLKPFSAIAKRLGHYPKAEQIDAFLTLTDNPATGKFFVHCAGGRHRTGVMGAVYPLTG